MKTDRLTILSRVLFVIYLICVGVLCFSNFGTLNKSTDNLFGIPMDKLVHFLMFAPYPILTMMSFPILRRGPMMLKLLAVFASGCALAGLTELIQYFIPYREGDLMDLCADALAMLLTSLIAGITCRFMAK